MKRWSCLAIFISLSVLGGCSRDRPTADARQSDGKEKKLKGEVKCDGSSTVYLITEAIASNFKKLHPDVNISIGIAGTGGGFRKFINAETDLQNASRKIKTQEADDCKKNGVEFIELQVAWDGLAVVVNKENTFLTKLTMEQMKKLWHPDSTVKTWKDLDPKFPDEPVQLWGAGKDSGTFDYFTEAVNGKERVIRQDYKGSEDDNVLVTGVSKNKYAMGFFGVAYYLANKNKLNVVALARKDGEFFEPTEANVLEGKYPISRPLFIYVNKKSLQREEVREFVDFYLRRADLVKSVGYVEMNTVQTLSTRKTLAEAIGK
jgi:phosphate transport system substrate-binding protein